MTFWQILSIVFIVIHLLSLGFCAFVLRSTYLYIVKHRFVAREGRLLGLRIGHAMILYCVVLLFISLVSLNLFLFHLSIS